MTTSVIFIGLLPLGLLVVRGALAIGMAAWRVACWLFEQPDGVAGAAGRLLVLGLILHSVGLL